MQPLTKGQKEIMEYVAKGLSNKEIAKIINVTESCVKFQIHLALARLNVHNRVKAVLIYLRDYKGIDFGDFLF